MNSLLQQLYHVPSFSLRLLGLAPDRRVDGDKKNGPLQEEDDVLLQLQVTLLDVHILELSVNLKLEAYESQILFLSRSLRFYFSAVAPFWCVCIPF